MSSQTLNRLAGGMLLLTGFSFLGCASTRDNNAHLFYRPTPTNSGEPAKTVEPPRASETVKVTATGAGSLYRMSNQDGAMTFQPVQPVEAKVNFEPIKKAE